MAIKGITFDEAKSDNDQPCSRHSEEHTACGCDESKNQPAAAKTFFKHVKTDTILSNATQILGMLLT